MDVKVAYYSDQVVSKDYEIAELDVVFDNGEIKEVNKVSIPGLLEYEAGNPQASNAMVTWDGNIVSIMGERGEEIKLEVVKENYTRPSAADPIKFTIPGFGSLDMQIGSNEGQQLEARIPKVSTMLMGISRVDETIKTEEGAKECIGKVDGAIKYVSSVRSRLGAYENRLDHTVNNLDIISENVTAAYSRIMDTDMSEEMTEYTTLQVLSQASTSILAQANERPAQVLQLLQ